MMLNSYPLAYVSFAGGIGLFVVGIAYSVVPLGCWINLCFAALSYYIAAAFVVLVLFAYLHWAAMAVGALDIAVLIRSALSTVAINYALPALGLLVGNILLSWMAIPVVAFVGSALGYEWFDRLWKALCSSDYVISCYWTATLILPHKALHEFNFIIARHLDESLEDINVFCPYYVAETLLPRLLTPNERYIQVGNRRYSLRDTITILTKDTLMEHSPILAGHAMYFMGVGAIKGTHWFLDRLRTLSRSGFAIDMLLSSDIRRTYVRNYLTQSEAYAIKMFVSVEVGEGAEDKASALASGSSIAQIIQNTVTPRTIIAREVNEGVRRGVEMLQPGSNAQTLDIVKAVSCPTDDTIKDAIYYFLQHPDRHVNEVVNDRNPQADPATWKDRLAGIVGCGPHGDWRTEVGRLKQNPSSWLAKALRELEVRQHDQAWFNALD